MRYLLVIAFAIFTTACAARTPVKPGTIPQQEDVMPNDEAYGQRVLYELNQTFPISASEKKHRRVRSIVQKLADAANAGTHPWHVYVLQDDGMLNAAATRGNHVFVWTGLLKLVDSDDELAAVLGHEIGHVLAQHTMPTPTESINEVLVSTAGVAANTALGTNSFGIGGQLVGMLAQAVLVNPESQRIELEADHIGLFLMAKAGYNPNASVTLWEKMSKKSGGDEALAFLSTHPPNSERIEQLQKLIPQTMNSYGKSDNTRDSWNRKQSDYKREKPDSFNLKPDNPLTKPGVEIWQVVEDFTAVFSKPDTKSRLREHLFHGTEVIVRRREGPWLEIEHPLRGYVLGRELSPK